MKETVDSGTRSENHRRMVQNIYSLTAKLFWCDTNNLNQWFIGNFHTQTLRQFKKRRLLYNGRSRLCNKNFLYIITHIFTLFWSLSTHYRSQEQRQREEFQGAKIQKPMENRKSLGSKEQKSLFDEQNERQGTDCNRGIKGQSCNYTFGQKHQNKQWREQDYDKTEMEQFDVPNGVAGVVSATYGSDHIEHKSLAKHRCQNSHKAHSSDFPHRKRMQRCEKSFCDIEYR